jgi:hypothetical protein
MGSCEYARVRGVVDMSVSREAGRLGRGVPFGLEHR